MRLITCNNSHSLVAFKIEGGNLTQKFYHDLTSVLLAKQVIRCRVLSAFYLFVTNPDRSMTTKVHILSCRIRIISMITKWY